MTLCKCGCGQEIIIKWWYTINKIPKYISGHNRKGTHQTQETKYKISKSTRGLRHHTEETKIKISQSLTGRKRPLEVKKKISDGQKGKYIPIEARQKMSKARKGIYYGEKSGNWKGGLSFLPYCSKFNKKLKESIRERDNRTCQKCSNKENGQRLSVHHIHYDKENCYPDLISLCRKCNSKVNSNRNYWEQYFMEILKEKNLLNWRL